MKILNENKKSKELLLEKFDANMGELLKVWDSVTWEDKATYGNWIAQTYFYVCHSTRLLALTASRFDLKNNKLHSRFVNHLGEEKGHETMAVRDLKALGFATDDFNELPELSAFYQTQYYWIEHIHPIGFLGWVLCLEGLAVKRGASLHTRLKDIHGEPATTFLKVHAAEDIEHLDKALALLDGLNESEIKIVFDNMKLSASLYSSMLNKLSAKEQRYKKVS